MNKLILLLVSLIFLITLPFTTVNASQVLQTPISKPTLEKVNTQRNPAPTEKFNIQKGASPESEKTEEVTKKHELQITLFVGIVAALAAILGSIIGGIVSYFVARMQFRTTVLSGNRQAWINSLRDCIAEFQSIALILKTDFAHGKVQLENLNVRVTKLLFLKSKITLLINPREQDHKDLVEQLDQASKIIIEEDGNMFIVTDKITELSQGILKREWERVKKGE